MIQYYENILNSEELQYILSVSKNQENLFTINLPRHIKEKIEKVFEISLPENVPMRWILGDTKPHIDTSNENFQNTYLMYITDSIGELIINNKKYNITQGSGFVFPENTLHETLNTGTEKRLLLGPINEKGIRVGFSGTIISAVGNTTVLIRKTNYNQYSLDNGKNWNSLNFPCTVLNTDTNRGILRIEFITDITIDSMFGFSCSSDNITFGSNLLGKNGTRPIITITANSFRGLVENGTQLGTGFSNIVIQNLKIKSSLLPFSGWFCASYYGGEYGTPTGNYVINCSTDADIGVFNGGIVGRLSSNLTVIGCSTYGKIDTGSGGIIGPFSCNITVSDCYSFGNIENGAGGICSGYSCYFTPGKTTNISNCYSLGNIENGGGGIIGFFSGYESNGININNCYSKGTIGENAGGICGRDSTNININNCYSTGSIATNGGGLIGTDSLSSTLINSYVSGGSSFYGPTGFIPTITNCLSSLIGWRSVDANTVLQGVPNIQSSIGSIWVSHVYDQPYELLNIGYTPYTTFIISNNNFVKTYLISAVFGPTKPAIFSGKSFTILNPISTIKINSNNGIIFIGKDASIGQYNLYIRNNLEYTGEYSISIVNLIVYRFRAEIPDFSIHEGNEEDFNTLWFLK